MKKLIQLIKLLLTGLSKEARNVVIIILISILLIYLLCSFSLQPDMWQGFIQGLWNSLDLDSLDTY